MSKEIQIVFSKPLLHYPDLTVGDIQRSALTAQEKEVIFASLNNVKVRNINLNGDSVCYNALIEIIGRTIWESGISTITESEMNILLPIIVQEINDEHKDLTIEDVRLAFKYGVRKKYGEYFGINIATISVWLQSYTNITKREALKRLSFVKVVDENKQLTEEEKNKLREIWLISIYNHFSKFKQTGKYEYFDYNNAFYKYCKKLRLINLTEDEQQEIWDIAVKELQQEYLLRKTQKHGQSTEVKSILENLAKGEFGKTEDELIINKCKKIVIKHLFIELIKKGIDLKEFIENAENKAIS